MVASGRLRSRAVRGPGAVEELELEEDPAEASRVRLTAAGLELYESTTAEISARLYADIPAEDLTTAGRVLTLITERANAESAGA